tara:strand:+ start:3409 stop:4326 length:918 start_codon:yes stop_codon:yes gene_type:complete
MPFFSVVIPTYNRSEMARDAVQSVLNQDFHDFELIVVDDGSSDNTSEVMASFSNKLHYHRQINGGVASARNMGISLSTGQYICYLDSDDLWPKNKLSIYKSLIDSRHNPAFIFSDFHKHDISLSQPYKASNTDLFPYILDLADSLGDNHFEVSGDHLLELLFRGYPLYPSTFAIRRDVHDHYRWDPGILKSEDFNLVLKISSRYSFTYLHESLSIVRVHSSNKSADFLTKNKINISSMKLYRDLYSPEGKRSLCNHYIAQKYFSDGKSYLSQGLKSEGLRSLLCSFKYSENWKRVTKKIISKIKG